MDKENMVLELQTMALANNGKTPSKNFFEKNSKTKSKYNIYFRTWNDFVIAAGLRPNYIRHRGGKDIDKDTVTLALMEADERHPDWTTIKLMRNCGISYKDVLRHFPSTYYVDIEIGRKNKMKAPKIHHIPVNVLRKEVQDLAIIYPDANTASSLISHSQYSKSTFFKNLGKDTILQIMTMARQRINYKKRYPVRYAAAPVMLKWARRRFINIKAV